MIAPDEQPHASQRHQDHRGGGILPKKRASRVQLLLDARVERLSLKTQAAKRLLKLFDVGVYLARPIPQIIVFHGRSSRPSFSRNSFMPRCRLTRTEAAVMPVRAAISGPVMPSTSRSTRVSR